MLALLSIRFRLLCSWIIRPALTIIVYTCSNIRIKYTPTIQIKLIH